MIIESKKTILFLIQSCNREDFLNEEFVVKETWAKDIVNGNIKNTHLLFYRSSKNGKTYIENDVLYVDEKDSYNSTYAKTIAALNYVNTNVEYDLIVKTNTSTYINLEILVNLVNSTEYNDDDIYGTRLIINGASKGYLYFRGNCMIFNKNTSKDIVSSYAIKALGPDDALIGFNLTKFWYKKGIDYFSKLKQFSIAYWDRNFSYDLEKCKKLVCYRTKINPSPNRNGKDIVKKMKKLDELIKKDEGKFELPTEFNKDGVETLLGLMPFEKAVIRAKNKLLSFFNQKNKMISSTGEKLYNSKNALRYMLD